MVKIYFPNNNIAEREYILDTIFFHFLGIRIKKIPQNELTDTWEILFDNGNLLIVKDSFFSKYPKQLEYLKNHSLPDNIMYYSHFLLPERNIPIIFGIPEISMNNNKIFCGIDLFASSFFMLCRWEEIVVKERDKFGRFSANSSIAFKFNFLERPVVNEYLILLKNMIVILDNTIKFKERSYSKHISCDIDFFRLPFMREIMIESLIRRRANSTLRLLNDFFKSNDYFWNGIFLIMNANEMFSNKVLFNIIPYSTSILKDSCTNFNNPKIKSLLIQIVQRGHSIGFHPGFDTYKNEKKFKISSDAFRKILFNIQYNSEFLGGRQHYLKWSFPETPRLWNKYHYSFDCTLGYADRSGFRCGVCYEYPLFDCLERKTYNFVEIPLIVMENTLFSYEKLNIEKAAEKIDQFKGICKKYNGVFSLLWHNSHLKSEEDFAYYKYFID